MVQLLLSLFLLCYCQIVLRILLRFVLLLPTVYHANALMYHIVTVIKIHD